MAKTNGSELPLGLGMALMRNADAFLYFSALDKKQQEKIIEESKSMRSSKEMRSFVEHLQSLG